MALDWTAAETVCRRMGCVNHPRLHQRPHSEQRSISQPTPCASVVGISDCLREPALPLGDIQRRRTPLSNFPWCALRDCCGRNAARGCAVHVDWWFRVRCPNGRYPRCVHALRGYDYFLFCYPCCGRYRVRHTAHRNAQQATPFRPEWCGSLRGGFGSLTVRGA